MREVAAPWKTAISTVAVVCLLVGPGIALAQGEGEPARPVIFAADFDATRPLNPPDEWPKWSYEGGAFVVQYPEGRDAFAYLAFRDDIGRLPARVRIEVSVTLLNGRDDQQFGIEVGHDLVEGSAKGNRGSRHPYQFGLTGNQEFVFYTPLPGRLDRRTDSRIKPAGETNRIAIEVEDTLVRCFVNGTLVAVHVAPDPVTGYLGFYVGAGVVVAFDDLRMEELR